MARSRKSITLSKEAERAVEKRANRLGWSQSRVIEFCVHDSIDELEGYVVPQPPEGAGDDDDEGNGWLDVIKGAA